MKKENYSIYFVCISIASVVLLLISNITATKLCNIGPIVITSSALLFPLTYIIGDIIAEVYGYKNAKFIIITGFIANLFMVSFFTLSIKLPPASTWNLQESYQAVLGTTPRIFIASLLSVLLGGLSNAYTLNVIKKITKNKHLWMRTIGSTIIGELIDTIIFVNIAFIFTVPTSVLISMVISQYLWKVIYESLATPLTYLVIKKYKRLEE